MSTITIKRGDTLLLTGVYKQSDGSAMNLTGYELEVKVINGSDRPVVTVVSGGNGNGNGNAKRSLTITNATTGAFTLVIKDTEVLKEDEYWIDFKATGASGYEQTSKALRLRVKNKLV